MKTILLALLVAVVGCSSKKSSPAPAAAPKTVEPTAANGAPAKITAKALWDLAQKDDTQFRKRFVVSGSVHMEEDTRVDLIVTDGNDKQLVKLFFATPDSRASAVTGSGTAATVTATCTLSGTTPMSVRLDDCTPGA